MALFFDDRFSVLTYSEEHIAHMRKVVAYCKRHLAQEQEMVDEKSEEELKTTKSYKSLKNWSYKVSL